MEQPRIQSHEENWENNAWKIANPSPLVFEPTFFAVAAKYAVTFSFFFLSLFINFRFFYIFFYIIFFSRINAEF